MFIISREHFIYLIYFFSIYIIQILQFLALLFSDSSEEPAAHFLSSSFIVPGDLDLIKEGFSTQQLVFYTGFLPKKERNFLIWEKYLFDQKEFYKLLFIDCKHILVFQVRFF